MRQAEPRAIPQAADCRALLLLLTFPRYNQIALRARVQSRLAYAALSAMAAFETAGCVAPLGPEYTIERQQVRVQFVPAPEPRIRVEAEYALKNTGNQPLNELELRLPGRRRFHFEEPHATWDATALATGTSTQHPRNELISLPQQWKVSGRHTLRLSVEYLPGTAGETVLSFANDAFF